MRQNRIAYIVSENPGAAAKLLRQEGFQVNNEIRMLIQAAKQWVREDGDRAIIELMKIHPEKKAILSATGHFDNFAGCGCQQSAFNGSGCGCGSKANSNFTGDPHEKELMERINSSSIEQLKERYHTIVEKLKEYPNDEAYQKEKELIEKYVFPTSKKERTGAIKPEPKGLFTVTKKDIIVGTFLLGLGVILVRLK